MDGVFIYKVNVNKVSGAVSVIVTDEKMTAQKAGAGLKLGTSTFVSTHREQQVTFGVLVLKDKKTGKLITGNAAAIKELQKLEKKQALLPGFKFTDNPVLSNKDKKPTGMYWVADQV